MSVATIVNWDTQMGQAKRNYQSYGTFIFRILKSINVNMGITKRAIEILNVIAKVIFERLVLHSSRLARYNSRKTITAREVMTTVRMNLPGELGKHAVTNVTRAMTTYNKSIGV